MPPTLNSCNLPRCHLRRIGPRGTMAKAPDIMDFHRVTYVIGRNSATMDYILDSDDEQQSKMISRCHARIVRQADNVHCVYDDSMNGMFVNNIKIADTAVLNEGDRVTFGHLRGAKLAAGTKVRQPESEYQFLFERCHCQPIIKELDATVGADEDTLSQDTPDASCKSSMQSKVGADKSVTILTAKKLQAAQASSDTTADVNPTSLIVNQIPQPLGKDNNSISASKSQGSEIDVNKRLSNNLESHPRDNKEEVTVTVQEFNLSFDSESDEEFESDQLTCCTQKILSDSSVESTTVTTVSVNKEDECKMSTVVGETDQVLTSVMDALLADVESMDVMVQEDAVSRDMIEAISTGAYSSSSQQKFASLEVTAPVQKSENLDKDCMTTENVHSEEISKDHVAHYGDDAERMPDMELESKPGEDTAPQSFMENVPETDSSETNKDQQHEMPQDISRNVDNTRAEIVNKSPIDMDIIAPLVESEATSEPLLTAIRLPEVDKPSKKLTPRALCSDATNNTVKEDFCSKNASGHSQNSSKSENKDYGSPGYVVPECYDAEQTLEPDDNDDTPPLSYNADNDDTPPLSYNTDNDDTPPLSYNTDNDDTPPLSYNSDESVSMSPTVLLYKQTVCNKATDFDDDTSRGDNGDVSLLQMEDNDNDTPFTDNVEDEKSTKMIPNALSAAFSESNRIVAIPYHSEIREKLLDARTTPPKRKQIDCGACSDILTSFSTAISSESPAKRQKLMTDFSFKSPLPKIQPSSKNADNCDDMLVDSETDEMLDHSTQSIQAMSDSQFTNAAESLDVKIEKGSRSSESRNKARKILERLRQKRKYAAKPTNITAPEPHPGTSDDSAFQDDLSHEEEMTNHLVPYEGNRPIDRINEYMMRCSDILKLMQRKLRGLVNQKTNPRVQAWMKALDDLDDKRKLPDTVIAVVGDTGAGKSSLMNAILDHASILPTSGMRACTAVVVEVVENTRSKNYEAEIIFLSKQEWQQEMEVLLNDLSGPDGKVRRGQPDPKTEAGVAFSKIRAVYGKVAELKVLSRIITITGWLGRTKHISTRHAADFRQQIDCYIESTDLGTGGQYWPIVKHVKVLIPNCDVCSSGAILVDLPGVRDSNAARDKIAKEYLKNCNTVWVVASIHRAIDDRTAKDLLGESFRRQLLMDGQYGSVAFVCTKTDVLTPSEIIGSLHIEAECEPLEKEISELELEKYNYERDERTSFKELKNMKKELKTMEEECEELQVDLAEAQSLLEHTDSEGDDNNDEQEQLDELESDLHEKEMCLNETKTSIASKEESISRLPSKILELESGIISRRKSLTAMCAKARNEYSKRQIRNDFKAGLREMKRKAAMGDDRDESDDEDDWLADGDDDSDHEIGSSADNLEVFCVSSTEYQKMRKLLKDGPPQVFSTLEETQIPTLKAHVHQMTAVRRRQGAERLIRNLGNFLFDLESYITDDGTESEGTRTNAKFAIDDHFKTIDQKFAPILSKLSSDINDIFDHSLGSKLQIGVANAVNESENSCAKWGAPRNKENKQAGGLHHCTYKATCNRYGMYTSPSYGPIDFNDQLAGPMCTAMMICWDKVFSGILWALLERTCASIQQEFVEFTGQIRLELNQLGVHVDRVERVNTQLLNTAKNKLAEMMGNLKVHITEKQRAVSRTVVPSIQESMKPIYTQCQGERGCGMYARMKAAMSLGIDYKKDTMYSAASLSMLEQLCDLQVEIVAMVKAACTTLCSELRASYEPLWEAPESARHLRIALHADVTELCDKIRVLFNDASIALPERKALVKRDVPPPRPSVMQNINSCAPNIRPGIMNSAFTVRPCVINSASTICPGVINSAPNAIRCVRVGNPDIPATVTRTINMIPSCRPQTIVRVVTPITVSNLRPTYNQPGNALHLNAADVLLMSEIDMLNKVDEIRKALLIHRTDIPKCVECLEALATLSITSNMLLKNPYVMDTIKKCRKYVGSELVRSKAEVVYQKLCRLPGQADAARQVATNSKENQVNKTRPEAPTVMKETSQNSVLQPITGVQLKKEVSNSNVKTEDASESYCTMFANNNLGRKIKQEPVIDDKKPNIGGSKQSPIVVIDATDYQPIKQEPGTRTKGRKRHLGMMDLTTD